MAQSKSFIQKIQKLSGSEIPVVYFPSWAEDVFTKKTTAQLCKEIPAKVGTFNVMFAGNIGEAQDFGCILEAAESLKMHVHIRWLIVGDGRMSGWVQSEIESRGLCECVLMVGRHSLERMPDFFAHADAMLVTLTGEEIFSMTIPGKLQSYLAAGMPVIAALNGEGAEVVRQANAGLTCPAGDAKGLATLVIKMSKLSGSELQLMGKNGLEFSNREFDRRKLIDSVENHLLGLCA